MTRLRLPSPSLRLPSFLSGRGPLIVAVLAAVLTAAAWPARTSRAQTQTYSGSATAVLGSSMTPQGTKELAFEKARQHALKKFGTHVLSEEKLASIETPKGIKEISTKRIVALAAGEARLRGGDRL